MIRILFVCSGNTCRSPMAEGIFDDMAHSKGLDTLCESAGISAADGLPASENAVKAVRELGVDISNHKSKSIDSVSLDKYDIIVPMTYTHAAYLIQMGVPKEKLYLFRNSVSDPYGGSLEVYRGTARELQHNLAELADFLKKQAEVSTDENNPSVPPEGER